MRRGLVRWGEEVATAKQYVHTFLRRQGVRYPKREIDVVVRGDRIVVVFSWEAGQPGMLIYWGGTAKVRFDGKR
jgi:hypothetical protein